ncbi:MAG TPA: peptidoglycan DD-metalloendopeptidase family protein [Saccharofermentans sp.]|nr:peptidoglycan DD-metalloendopeptidase family protein [Saccharofermentans sp.]
MKLDQEKSGNEVINKTMLIKSIVCVVMIAVGVVLISTGLGHRVAASDNYQVLLQRAVELQADELEDRRNERDQALADAQAAAEMASELSAEAGELSGELEELNQLSEEQMAQYQIIAQQLADALIAKAEALDRYVVAQDNLAAEQETFSTQISVMYEYQNTSTLEIMLQSDSIAGFFTNMEIITLIADAQAQAVDNMQVALDDAQAQADYALQEATDMENAARERQEQLQELEDRIGVTTAALNDINIQISQYEQLEDELNATAEQLNNEIYALQHPAGSSSSGGGSTGSGSGVLSWPTWTTYVTSEYGNRTHPVYGTQRFHSGIDIGAGFGDSVMAAASGTVIIVSTPCPGCNYGGSGYGNYVVIDHGDGLSTLYGHMTDVYVSNGSYVNAGDSIGTVGSTGTSTGAHLHFEVSVNGTTVSPRDYL